MVKKPSMQSILTVQQQGKYVASDMSACSSMQRTRETMPRIFNQPVGGRPMPNFSLNPGASPAALARHPLAAG